jgi:hypothetical protein
LQAELGGTSEPAASTSLADATEMENDLVPFQVEATSDVLYLPTFTLVD